MSTKYAFITGANRGIGFETARQLVQQNISVFLGARSEANGREAVEKLRKEGLQNVQYIPIEITNEQTVQKAVQTVTNQVNSLDILINNAGVLGSMPQNAVDFPVEKFKRIFEVNFFGTVRTTQAFLPLLSIASVPTIINVTSGLSSLALHKNPEWHHYEDVVKFAAYGPSKTALNAYTLMLSKEMKDTSFCINAVSPGITSTRSTNYKGKDVSDAAAFIVKYATMGADAPTGKFFEYEGEGNIAPW